MTDADPPTAGDDSASPGSANDPTARLLRQTLQDEAAEVHPDPQALHSIRQRTDAAGGHGASAITRRQPWLLGAFGAAAATVAVITGFAVIGNSGGTPDRPAAGGALTVGHPGPAAASMHPGVFNPSAPAAQQLTMYYIGTSAGSGAKAQFRLFPETHTAPAGSASAVAAVHEFLTSRPMDPDYRSGWPTGVDVTDISTSGGVTTIALTGADPGTHPDPVPYDPARPMALQALLATAGVEGKAAFTYNGKPVRLILHESADAQRQSDYATRAFISITSPVEGQTVSSPVTVHGSANVFEGNLNWDLRNASGHVVRSGKASAGSMQWKPFSFSLGTLQPGMYTIRAYETSPKNGRPTYVDDKTFTVR